MALVLSGVFDDCDGGEETAGEMFAAVAEEEIGAAGSAEIGDEDVFRRNACV